METLSGITNYRAFSRLVGKRIVEPLPKTKSDFWPFAEVSEQEYASFIIDVNENGDEIIYTSNPDAAQNASGSWEYSRCG